MMEKRNGGIRGVRHRLRLSEIYECMHTQNKYGMKYGTFGLMSVQTFMKMIALYSEFLMYSFNLISTANTKA